MSALQDHQSGSLSFFELIRGGGERAESGQEEGSSSVLRPRPRLHVLDPVAIRGGATRQQVIDSFYFFEE